MPYRGWYMQRGLRLCRHECGDEGGTTDGCQYQGTDLRHAMPHDVLYQNEQTGGIGEAA